ncbi:MAG TPA: site-specific DNA-methyltransferase [Xanthobacteraceae bacterium]|nr:site-specific DNA-methyltransferase [Xanthobacteraceae bacterium]
MSVDIETNHAASIEISAVKGRPDGTTEDLGVIASSAAQSFADTGTGAPNPGEACATKLQQIEPLIEQRPKRPKRKGSSRSSARSARARTGTDLDRAKRLKSRSRGPARASRTKPGPRAADGLAMPAPNDFDKSRICTADEIRPTLCDMSGTLFYGDNLDVLRSGKFASESVDLIYLDPPFNSDRNYNVIYKQSQAQHDAFRDTWSWDDAAESAYHELTERPLAALAGLSNLMRTFKDVFGTRRRDTLAYLSMMAIRLVEIRRVLRSTGSLYLHCDPTASHYLKIILDEIFGPSNFRSEIVWKRTFAHGSADRWGDVHDVIFFYTKSDEYTWTKALQPYEEAYLTSKYRFADERGRYRLVVLTAPGTTAGESGKPWRGYNPTTAGRHWAVPRDAIEIMRRDGKEIPEALMDQLELLYQNGLIRFPQKKGGALGVPEAKRYLVADGLPVQDIITDIAPINSQAAERLGYPTQKPVALLERILSASSRAGDLVLDPFCGCGSTIEAAEKLGRKWIGIDIAIRAIDIIKDRLDANFPGDRVWTEIGEPSGVEGAAHLAETNAYDFQWWAVRRLGGQPPKGEKKKGGDGGIDGEMMLREFNSPKTRRAIISVKSGRTLTPDMVKALKSTVDLEKADCGILVTMHPPTQGMRDVARDFGLLSWASDSGKRHHKITIITVPEILAGTVRLPGVNVTPRSRSAPPPAEPRIGETLQIPFPPATPSRMGGPKKAKGAEAAPRRKGEPVKAIPREVPAKVATAGRSSSKPTRR